MEVTKEEAIELAKSDFWKEWNAQSIALFQLSTRRLCIPINVYQKALEEALERPVWTHELVDPGRLIDELLGRKPVATFREIMSMIPNKKIIPIDIDKITDQDIDALIRKIKESE